MCLFIYLFIYRHHYHYYCWEDTSNLPTKIISAKIPWFEISGKSPMGARIPPLTIKIMLESKPLKSRILILVRGLAVWLPKSVLIWPRATFKGAATSADAMCLLLLFEWFSKSVFCKQPLKRPSTYISECFFTLAIIYPPLK